MHKLRSVKLFTTKHHRAAGGAVEISKKAPAWPLSMGTKTRLTDEHWIEISCNAIVTKTKIYTTSFTPPISIISTDLDRYWTSSRLKPRVMLTKKPCSTLLCSNLFWKLYKYIHGYTVCIVYTNYKKIISDGNSDWYSCNIILEIFYWQNSTVSQSDTTEGQFTVSVTELTTNSNYKEKLRVLLIQGCVRLLHELSWQSELWWPKV